MPDQKTRRQILTAFASDTVNRRYFGEYRSHANAIHGAEVDWNATLLPAQPLQLPCPDMSLRAIDAIFPFIDEARTPTPTVPNTKERIRTTAEKLAKHTSHDLLEIPVSTMDYQRCATSR